MDELPPATKRQYSNIVQYDTDRAAYRRVYILQGKTKEEADILLGMAEDIAEIQLNEEETQYTYFCNRGNEGYRYSYTTVVRDGIVISVYMRNHHLGVVKDTLIADPEEYSIKSGDSLFGLSAKVQILPTYAGISENGSVTLGYGLESAAADTSELPYKSPLVVHLNSKHQVTETIIN